MAMPELIFDNENHFVDITNDEVRIRFAETEEIEGHVFKHVEYGIFAAEPAFEISHADMYDLVVNYRDVVYVVECVKESQKEDKCIYKVIFAFSSETSERYSRLNYINNLDRFGDIFGVKSSKLKNYYDFNKRLEAVEYGYYRTDKLDRDNLPENKSALALIYRTIELPDGRRPWIKLKKHIGIEVEEGIYYFAKSGDSIGNGFDRLPVVDLNTSFANDYVAAICHSTDIHFSSDVAIEYLAIGKEHFSRLEEIQRLLDCGFYLEYKFEDNKIENEGEVQSETRILDISDIVAIAQKVSENDNDKVEDDRIPDDAEELITGFGFTNLCVSYERPFFESAGFCEYDVAYKQGNQLVLGRKKNNAMVYEYHDLRFLSGLFIKKITRLNSGIDYPVIHKVIDCKDVRLQEILTPEAYSLYMSELNAKSKL